MDARSCVVCQRRVDDEDHTALQFVRSEQALVVQAPLLDSSSLQPIFCSVATQSTCGHLVHQRCWRRTAVRFNSACPRLPTSRSAGRMHWPTGSWKGRRLCVPSAGNLLTACSQSARCTYSGESVCGVPVYQSASSAGAGYCLTCSRTPPVSSGAGVLAHTFNHSESWQIS